MQMSTEAGQVLFQIVANVQEARRGVLASASGKRVDTPALLLHTIKCSPQNMPKDLAEAIENLQCLHLDAGDIVDQQKSILKSGMTLDNYFCLNGRATFVGVRNPSTYHENACSGGSFAVSVTGGFQKVSPKEYVEIMQATQPEFFVAPSYDLPALVSNKRTKKCVDSTVKWHSECVQLAPQLVNRMFGVIQGGPFKQERERCAKQLVELNLAGYVLGGLGLDETPEQRMSLIDQTKSLIPVDKPRLVVGIGSPDEVLDAISQGIDLFSNFYPNMMAETGLALIFELEPDVQSSTPMEAPNKLNLRDVQFELDTQPVLPGCPCYTCRKHTRAYIHHLINTQEMLANILLVIHNTHHYLKFFSIIRTRLEQGSFGKYRQAFLDKFGAAQ